MPSLSYCHRGGEHALLGATIPAHIDSIVAQYPDHDAVVSVPQGRRLSYAELSAAVDPLARMLVTADGFAQMTPRIRDAAAAHCDGKLVLVHEGGYSEVYVPFCGHATIATLAASSIAAPDPLAETLRVRQPGARFDAFLRAEVARMGQDLLG